MADVTIPTIGAGTSNGTVVEQNFYNPTGSGTTSAEIINGHLDNANRDASWTINRSHIQSNSLSGGKTQGGTLSLDYFGDLFPTWDKAKDQTDHADRAKMDALYQVIPGAAVSFYIPYNVSFVALSWHIHVSADQRDNVKSTDHASHPANYIPARIRLFYDGSRVDRRLLDVPAKNFDADNMLGSWDRAWLGHYLAMGGSQITKGWHTASLRIVVDPGYNATGGSEFRYPTVSCQTHCRVRVRSMDYVFFH